MDIKGLGEDRYLRMPRDRVMNTDELNSILVNGDIAHDVPSDQLSVVEINSEYLELVDRWYAHKGHTLFYALCLLGTLSFGLLLFLFPAIHKNEAEAWYSYLSMITITLPFMYIGVKGFFWEGFQKTYYPLRLDRKRREVYAILPKNQFLKIDWDDLVIHIAKNKISMISGYFYEVRGFVLDKESGKIKHSITLGYPPWGGYDEAVALWEFIRRYMEDKHGYEHCSRIVKVCMPIKHSKESIGFSITRGMSLLAPNYVLQFLSSPLLILFIWCRILSVKTSQLPVWPEWVERQYSDIASDDYDKEARDNERYSFWESTWPLICFFVGSVVTFSLASWLGFEYWLMYQ